MRGDEHLHGSRRRLSAGPLTTGASAKPGLALSHRTQPGERALGDRHERRFRVSTTAAGNLDWHSARTSTSPGAIPATYTGPATLSATPDAVMTAPPYEWPTSRTGPGPARSCISCTRPRNRQSRRAAQRFLSASKSTMTSRYCCPTSGIRPEGQADAGRLGRRAGRGR